MIAKVRRPDKLPRRTPPLNNPSGSRISDRISDSGGGGGALFRFARYCWRLLRLRSLYRLGLRAAQKLGINHRVRFHENRVLSGRHFSRREAARAEADAPPGTRDLAEKMRAAPGYDEIDFGKIKPLEGVSTRYYEPGAFNLRGQVNKAKFGIAFNRASWRPAPAPGSDKAPDGAVNHETCCLAVPRITGESFALKLFHLFTCFLYLRNLKRQGYETECLLLDGNRDKLSELFTACLPGCRFPEDFSGVHRFRRVLFAQRQIGWRDLSWRQVIYTCGLAQEFHRFVLPAFDIAPPEPSRRVETITVIRRRQHVADGGKPCIDRVVRNEEEIIKALAERYPSREVQGVYFEQLPLREQLLLFSRSDLTVSMHGAGLIAAAYFAPPNAGILELFPKYYRVPESVLTCRLLAADRGLHYGCWVNHRRAREFGTDVQPGLGRLERYQRTPIRYASSTQVPVRALIRRIDRLIRATEGAGRDPARLKR